MITPNTKSTQPVILCHAACTGGSLIYRLLLSAFDFIGVGEVGHVHPPKLKDYLPLDPEAQLYGQGVISSQQFADIFFKRIRQCEKRVTSMGQVLLIREHSHQYFFNIQQKQIDLNSVSWINDAYYRESEEPLICLVSVRDPIDSWLGLRNSFPNEKPSEFDEYCKKYLKFLDMVERTKSAYLFKYEELVRDPRGTLSKIGKVIGRSSFEVDLNVSANVTSSGNSGRKSSKIVARPRRPFTKRLVVAANTSENYAELCRRLGYQRLEETVGCKDPCGLHNNCFYDFFSDSLSKAALFFKKLSVKFPRIVD